MRKTAILHAGLSAIALAAAGQSAAADELIVGGFGGNFAKAVEACHIPAFAAATGDTVVLQEGNSSQLAATIRATRGQSDYDIVYIDNSFSTQLAAESLLEQIAVEGLTNAPDLVAGAISEDKTAVQYQWGATALAYDPEVFPTAPDSWEAIFDPANQGKIALPDIAGTAGVHFLIAAAKLRGGDIDNLDPGFAAIKEITPGVVAYYSQADQLISMFERKEVALAPWYPDRAAAAADAGLKIATVYPKEGAIGIKVTLVIPKGAQNPEAALKYIDAVLAPEVQSCFAEKMYAGPVNTKTELTGRAAETVPQSVYEALYFPDPATVAQNVADWRQRWQREITR